MKKSAKRPWPWSNRSAQIRVVPGSNHSQSLMGGNFEALSPTDPIIPVWNDLTHLKNIPPVQQASCGFRINFALSKQCHLHRAYLVIGRYSSSKTAGGKFGWN